jgi:hypothetical protein
MKTLVSLFLVTLSLLAEISMVAGNPWCEIERAKIENSESAETSENLVPSIKIKTQVRRNHFVKLSVVSHTYKPADVVRNANLASNLLFNQHLVKQRTSPIYLNNSVFLI